jgi:hypothetical protein
MHLIGSTSVIFSSGLKVINLALVHIFIFYLLIIGNSGLEIINDPAIKYRMCVS